ncbi:Protein of unknown function DUF1635 [Dillenia turbinata]|uniref:Uncharacterized protein n=1 Tax=Dillenia turbinata TaxID=194707 RepID=A0AAN8VKJ1_9MAGN
MLRRAIRERDEAQDKCQRLRLEKLILQHHQQQQNLQTTPLFGISSIEDDPRRRLDSNNGFSSSDCDESLVSSPVMDQIPQPQPQLSTLPPLPPPLSPPAQPSQPLISIHEADIELVPEKPLPEKGKLLQAVMKAGTLPQTLLLASPLPQWRHPHPTVDSYEIPPVTIPSPPSQHIPQQDPLVNTSLCTSAATANSCARANKKRALCEEAELKPGKAKQAGPIQIAQRYETLASGLQCPSTASTRPYGVRVGVAYLVMLAVMLFDLGILIAEVVRYSAEATGEI